MVKKTDEKKRKKKKAVEEEPQSGSTPKRIKKEKEKTKVVRSRTTSKKLRAKEVVTVTRSNPLEVFRKKEAKKFSKLSDKKKAKLRNRLAHRLEFIRKLAQEQSDNIGHNVHILYNPLLDDPLKEIPYIRSHEFSSTWGKHTIIIVISDRMLKKPMLNKLVLSLSYMDSPYTLYRLRTSDNVRPKDKLKLKDKDNVFLYEKAGI